MILTIKTSTPDCELSIYEGTERKAEVIWEAGRQLAIQLPGAIEELLNNNNQSWGDLRGIIVFQGPGSFTGLRIGITAANTIAYAQSISIVSTQNENWIQEGLKKLQAGNNDKTVLPHYGGEAHITIPKK